MSIAQRNPTTLQNDRESNMLKTANLKANS